MKKPFFSVIVPVLDKTLHLLPFTLDSIVSQEFEGFEIVLIDGQSGEHDLDLFNAYQPHISRIYSALDRHPFSMKNKGLMLARGKYLHFLDPGEFYMTCHALSLMRNFIEACDFPDLIYTGSVSRYSLSLPQVSIQQISEERLRGGDLPTSLQSYWFQKEALVALGGFNAAYEIQGGVDVICRFYLSPSYRKAFLKRILTDYEYRRLSPKKVIQQFIETLMIICRHFGLSKALVWWLAQNHLRLLKWWWRSIRGAFWKTNRI